MTEPPKNRVSRFKIRGEMMFCDKGIAPYIKEINEMGHYTYASCSGMVIDHGEPEGPYICFDVGLEPVVYGGLFDFPDTIGDEVNNYAQCLEKALHDSGIVHERSKYLIAFPTICGHFRPPIPHFLEDTATHDAFKLYDEREKRLKKNDKCYNSHLPDEEIDLRFKLLTKHLKACVDYIPASLKNKKED